MPVQAVLFDLGNTLVDYYDRHEFRPILRECLQRVQRATGVADDIEELFLRALELNREAPDHAVRPLVERIHELLPNCKELSGGELVQVCRAFMEPIFACAKLNSAAFQVLDALRDRGLRTAIVSNTPWGSPSILWREELRRHSLIDRVNAAVFCVDVGWRKPADRGDCTVVTDLADVLGLVPGKLGPDNRDSCAWSHFGWVRPRAHTHFVLDRFSRLRRHFIREAREDSDC